MGTSCLEQNAIVEIDGKEHRLHRKITGEIKRARAALLMK